MKPQLEITTITTNGIDVNVKIDYSQKKISLVEPNGYHCDDKKWLFSGRGVEYMKGWHNILGAMAEGIIYGEKKLKAFIKKETAEKIKIAEELEKAGI